MPEVEVPFGDDASETATLLLAAAEDLELDPHVVKTTGDQRFVVPQEVADKAGVKYDEEDSGQEQAADEEPDKPVAKKATPRKRAAKKAAGK